MTENQLSSQLKQLISQVLILDWSRLYPDGGQVSLWNNYSREDIKLFVNSVYEMLTKLEKRQDLDLCGYNILTNLSSYLTNFINSYASVTGLVDSQISTQHHQALSYLNQVNDYIRSSGLYTELRFDPKENLKKISDALDFGEKLLQNKEAFEKTSEVFNEVLKDKEAFTQNLLNDKGKLFDDMADEYKTFKIKTFVLIQTRFGKYPFIKYLTTFTIFYGSFLQMVLAFIFGLGIMLIVYSFIEAIKEDGSISPGVAILRISALIVPSYFAFFFAKQFQLSQKMYKFYKFKALAMTTMSSLFPTYPTQQDKIMEKAISVIFSEFNEKASSDLSQKDLLDFVSKVAQSRG